MFSSKTNSLVLAALLFGSANGQAAVSKMVVDIKDGVLVSMQRADGKKLKIPGLNVRTIPLPTIFSETGAENVYGVEFTTQANFMSENPSTQEINFGRIKIVPKQSNGVDITCTYMDETDIGSIDVPQANYGLFLGKCRLAFSGEKANINIEELQERFNDYFEFDINMLVKRAATTEVQAKFVDDMLTAKVDGKSLGKFRDLNRFIQKHKNKRFTKRLADNIAADIIGRDICQVKQKAGQVLESYESGEALVASIGVVRDPGAKPLESAIVEIDCEKSKKTVELIKSCDPQPEESIYGKFHQDIANQAFDMLFNRVENDLAELRSEVPNDVVIETPVRCAAGTEVVLKDMTAPTEVKTNAPIFFKD